MTITSNSITAIDDVDAPVLDVATITPELIDIHRRAGHHVAELSESSLWAQAEASTIRLIIEASAIAKPEVATPAEDAPAVVRCRELAHSQRHMVAALNGIGVINVDAGTVARARSILDELAQLCATIRA